MVEADLRYADARIGLTALISIIILDLFPQEEDIKIKRIKRIKLFYFQ
jgi:hypothetical protein